jgi:hypothetical protein
LPGPSGDAWQWNGLTWEPAAALPDAGARYGAAAATLGTTAFLFSGNDSTFNPTADLFAWDGANWSASPQAGHWPKARAGSVFVNAPGGLLLFGGTGLLGPPFGDTWLWNGANWTPQDAPDASPAFVRAYASAAAWGSEVVLFGGEDDETGVPSNETWVWNGSTWTQPMLPPSSPVPEARSYATMASIGGQVVLFGGLDRTPGAPHPFLGDTWIWNGSWTPGPVDGPSPRFGATMASF